MVFNTRRILFSVVILVLYCSCVSTTEYTLNDLVKPVAGLNQLLIASDNFDQFFYTENNDFAKIFYEYFLYNTYNFKKRQSVTLKVTDKIRDEIILITIVYLGTNQDENHNWHFSFELSSSSQFFDIETHELGIPLRFRFRDRLSGEYYEKIPETSNGLFHDIEKLGMEKLSDILNDGKTRLIDNKIEEFFNNPVNTGEEKIKIEAGKFTAVHFYDNYNEQGRADYWISHKVPGSLVKIVYRDGEGLIISEVELIRIEKKTDLEIPDGQITAQPPYDRGVPGLDHDSYSEGSIMNPLLLVPGIIHYGSVDEEGESFYSLHIEKNTESLIRVKNVFGQMELLYYGRDHTYNSENEIVNVTGLSINEHAFEEEADVYFSIRDKVDLYSSGEFFEIETTSSQILTPPTITGINLIHNEAVSIKPGFVFFLNEFKTPLYYMKIIAAQEGNLEIRLFDDISSGRLFFYGTQKGYYNYVLYEQEQNEQILKIVGIQPDTVCYFYYCLPDFNIVDTSKINLIITEY